MSARATGRSRPWLRWFLPAVVVLVGLAFLTTTFTNDLFAVGPAFEEMIDDFRPLLQDEALAQAQADLEGLGAVSAEFESAVVPTMAVELGMAPEEFQAMLGRDFPAVATGAAALPDIGAEFTGLVGLLADQQELFASADEIPTADLPATTVPWGILLAGLAVIAAGALLFQWRPWGAWFVMSLGVLLVAVPVILSLPQKSADADDLNDNLEPVYTVETVLGAQEALGTVSAMATEMQEDMLPALATQLGLAPEQLDGFLGENFPALAASMQAMPDTLGRFGTFVETFNNNLDNYDTLRPVAFTPIIQTIIVGGVVVLLAGGAMLWLSRSAAGEPAAVERKERDRIAAGV